MRFQQCLKVIAASTCLLSTFGFSGFAEAQNMNDLNQVFNQYDRVMRNANIELERMKREHQQLMYRCRQGDQAVCRRLMNNTPYQGGGVVRPVQPYRPSTDTYCMPYCNK